MSSYEYLEPETPREQRDRPTGRHPVNIGHLVMGTAFVGLTVVLALYENGVVDLPEQGWVLGLPWIAAGVLGLLASMLRGRAPRRDRASDSADDTADTEHGPSAPDAPVDPSGAAG